MIANVTKAVLIKTEKDGFLVHPAAEEVAKGFPQKIRASLGAFFDDTPVPLSAGCPVRILYHKRNSGVFEDWGEQYLKASVLSEPEPYPLLHFLFGIDLIHPELTRAVVFPRSSRVLDSSIWNYCVWRDGQGEDRYQNRLERALSEIYQNWELHLYELGTALEYADLHSRLSENSFFKGGHHGEQVSPFLFHSESFTRECLEKVLKEWTGKGHPFCFGHQWRFLLVDDHSSTQLSARWKDEACPGGPTKLDIILSRLRSLPELDHPIRLAYRKSGADQWEGDTENYDIAIDCVSDIAGLVSSLFGENKKRYDIILMDYLLGDAEYSYDFLYVLKSLCDLVEADCGSSMDEKVLEIVQSCEALPLPAAKSLPLEVKDGVLSIYGQVSHPVNAGLKDWILDGIGPMRRLYFMYISSFVHAIQERLEEQRISRADKYWYIGRGSCPLNTPEVFLFNLHLLMEKRLRKIVESGDDFRFESVSGFLSGIFGSNKVRETCRMQFPRLLRIKAIFGFLSRDIRQGEAGRLDGFSSILLQSIFQHYEKYDADFWEHLQHLCYLVSFGTDRQKPELWEEYLYVKPTLDQETSRLILSFILGLK